MSVTNQCMISWELSKVQDKVMFKIQIRNFLIAFDQCGLLLGSIELNHHLGFFTLLIECIIECEFLCNGVQIIIKALLDLFGLLVLNFFLKKIIWKLIEGSKEILCFRGLARFGYELVDTSYILLIDDFSIHHGFIGFHVHQT